MNVRRSQGPCDFCLEASGEFGRTEAGRLYPELSHRDLVRSGSLFVVPSLGQLVLGHLLVIPFRHVTSIAGLVGGHPQVEDELQDVLAGARRTYGSVIVFEHGTCDAPEAGGCGIVHAHLHVMPATPSMVELPPLSEGRWVETVSDAFGRLCRQSSRGEPYIYYGRPDGRAFVTAPSSVSSQFVRRWLSNQLDAEQWDWRTFGRQETFLATLRQQFGRPMVGSGHQPSLIPRTVH